MIINPSFFVTHIVSYAVFISGITQWNFFVKLQWKYVFTVLSHVFSQEFLDTNPEMLQLRHIVGLQSEVDEQHLPKNIKREATLLLLQIELLKPKCPLQIDLFKQPHSPLDIKISIFMDATFQIHIICYLFILIYYFVSISP